MNINNIYKAKLKTSIGIPIALDSVHAGFPSPAEDYIDRNLDLNKYLIKRPSSTYFMRVTGDSMINAGIHSGDILIVDRSLEVTNGKIIIAAVNGELTVKRFIKKSNREIYLYPENPEYPIIKIEGNTCFETWGVVIYAIHKAE